MQTPRPAVFLIDAGHFRGQNKTRLTPQSRDWRRHISAVPVLNLKFFPQTEQPRFGRLQPFLNLRQPGRMSEVTGRQNIDALGPRPSAQVGERQVARAGPRKFRMDVEIDDVTHSRKYRVSGILHKGIKKSQLLRQFYPNRVSNTPLTFAADGLLA